jgi:hypothetical protein
MGEVKARTAVKGRARLGRRAQVKMGGVW